MYQVISLVSASVHVMVESGKKLKMVKLEGHSVVESESITNQISRLASRGVLTFREIPKPVVRRRSPRKSKVKEEVEVTEESKIESVDSVNDEDTETIS